MAAPPPTLLSLLDDVLGPVGGAATAAAAGALPPEGGPQRHGSPTPPTDAPPPTPPTRPAPGRPTRARRLSGAVAPPPLPLAPRRPRLDARHAAVERGWAAHATAAAAATGRPPEELVFSRSHGWGGVAAAREALEVLAGVAADERGSPTVAVESWAATLRNPIRDARGHAGPPDAVTAAGAVAAAARGGGRP